MNILSKLGPGLLYAAAAIGVSHLIQSTRAGAQFGNELIWVIIIANLLKYPFFKAGPLYAAKTGKTLIDAYEEIGLWALAAVIALTVGVMFIIQAAVTIVTAGIANSVLGLSISAPMMSLILLVLCFLILTFGKYDLLDNIVKYVVVILAITTLTTVGFGLFTDFAKPLPAVNFSFSNNSHLFFLIALVGWMPAPLDIPIWHSLWVVERNKNEKSGQSARETIFDFNVGYIGTALVAILFLLLGSLVMYRSETVFSPKAAVFASQLIELYTKSLGPWSYPIIAIAAFTTMFSTTLTCLDGAPRVMKASINKLLKTPTTKDTYPLFIILIVIGTSIILFGFIKNMKEMVDFATTLSFVIAPIYAFLNYLLLLKMHKKNISKLPVWENILAVVGLIFLISLTIYYLAVRY